MEEAKKPCPFCGGCNLSITCDVKQGHGDCSYDGLRVVCAECKATKGVSDWGTPDREAEQKAWDAWNKRV
jgi:Lar family restriction alleviation protein